MKAQVIWKKINYLKRDKSNPLTPVKENKNSKMDMKNAESELIKQQTSDVSAGSSTAATF